jgi:hypothetical protein
MRSGRLRPLACSAPGKPSLGLEVFSPFNIDAESIDLSADFAV